MKTATKESILKLSIIMAIILTGAAVRFMDLPPNFSPVGAMAIFAGAFFTRRSWALALPLGVMLLSDLFLGFYSGIFYVYLAFGLSAMIGFYFLKNFSWGRFGATNLSCALLFFVVSNFGVWLTTPLYSKNFAGLVSCFEMAIPFFRNTLASQFFFAAVFFGVYELATRASGIKAKAAL